MPETDIQGCCLKNYIRYEEEQTMKQVLFQDFVQDLGPMQNLVRISRGWRQKRYRCWLLLEYPTSTFMAKVLHHYITSSNSLLPLLTDINPDFSYSHFVFALLVFQSSISDKTQTNYRGQFLDIQKLIYIRINPFFT